MTKSMSEDLRSRVIAAVDGGLSRRAAAEPFGVGTSTAIRWVREWARSLQNRRGEIGDHSASSPIAR